ncbi:hypothetical protein [Photobacterium rosenbergii]|uniref:hypothetical protein n=1 Tax=Photobacterium rosenbergii TaxID=294936 RepID=UPI001C995371|nr:hypothetical protein [Photobacterium rosenbergii]MBY5944785.1 hypothetical protein [Photobacterium rosenbergii]
MNSNIIAIVNKCENLSLKVNVGERYRISKSGLKGSLWLQPQQAAFRLKLTGDVKSRLSSFVIGKVGSKSHDDQDNPVWHLPFDGSMEVIVSAFNEL